MGFAAPAGCAGGGHPAGATDRPPRARLPLWALGNNGRRQLLPAGTAGTAALLPPSRQRQRFTAALLPLRQ